MNFSKDDQNIKTAYRVAYLLSAFIQKKLTEPESKELDEWISKSENNKKLFEDLTNSVNVENAMNWIKEKFKP